MSTPVYWRNIILLIVNSGSLFNNSEEFCHSFGCYFLRSLSIKLNSVRVVLLVLCCSQLDVVLTACHIFKTDSLSCLLGWAEQLQTLRKLYQGAEMGLTFRNRASSI
jgi:hypothetical protein